MNVLPLELLQTIGLYLTQPDLNEFIKVNRRTAKIPTERFWQDKCIHGYPTRSKPADKTWERHFIDLEIPLVRYYDVYTIDSLEQVKFRDYRCLKPDYSWFPIPPMSSEDLTNELRDTLRENRELQAGRMVAFRQVIVRLMQDQTQTDLLRQAIQTHLTHYTEAQRAELEAFLADPEHFEFPPEAPIEVTPISDTPNKVYLLTSNSHELVGIIDGHRKFVTKPHSDCEYIFGIGSDCRLHTDLKRFAAELSLDDEVGMSFLLDSVQYISRDYAAHKAWFIAASHLRLLGHLNDAGKIALDPVSASTAV